MWGVHRCMCKYMFFFMLHRYQLPWDSSMNLDSRWMGKALERRIWELSWAQETSSLLFLCCVLALFGSLDNLATLFPIVRNKQNFQKTLSGWRIIKYRINTLHFAPSYFLLLSRPFLSVSPRLGPGINSPDLCLVSLITSRMLKNRGIINAVQVTCCLQFP